MNKKRLIASLTVQAALIYAPVAHAAPAIRAMILDGESGGPYHAWRETTPYLKRMLEETGLFQVDEVSAPPAGGDFSGFKPDWGKYQVVVFNYDAPDERWPGNLKASFENYVRGGGGLVVVHAADNAFPKWPEYNLMIGVGGWRGRDEKSGPFWYFKDGKLVSDPSAGPAGRHGARLPFQVENRVTDHPITQGLPKVWMHAGDELYAGLRGPGENTTVLSTAYSDPANHGTGHDEPTLMVIAYGKGRVFHTVLGHDLAALSCAGFITTYQRGTEWAATGKVTQKVPPDFPTADKTSRRAAYVPPPGWTSPGASRAAAPALDPTIYWHVSRVLWVASDLDRVVDYWQKMGIRDIRRDGVVAFPNLTYHGQPDPATAKRIVGRAGGLEIEWIQPVQGGKFWSEGLREHGDGIRAIGYDVRTPQEFDDQIKYFASKGVSVVTQGDWQGHNGRGRFAFLDTAGQGGGNTLALIDDPDAEPAPSVDSTPNEYPLTKITHFAWVVRDVKQVDSYDASLGFKPFSSVDHNFSLDRTYRGQPGTYEMWLGWDRSGDAPFEWVQQITGHDIYVEYLAKHGEGFHHLGVNVTDMDEAIKLMTARGAPPSQTAAWNTPRGKGRAVYVDTEPYGGVTLELIYDPR
jgi:type 1 glutamine amidotransferase